MGKRPRKPINQVLADNLAEAMESAGITTQAELAKRSGVAQRTISNYLNPSRRTAGKSAKEPSAKLSEVEQIAKALGVEPWSLLRPLRPGEREFYEKIEAAYRALHKDDDPPQ